MRIIHSPFAQNLYVAGVAESRAKLDKQLADRSSHALEAVTRFGLVVSSPRRRINQ